VADQEKIRIGTEDEAFVALEAALAEGVPAGIVPVFDFVNWPIVKVRLPDTPVNSSISPSMMEAFIELQKTIYRAHTFISSDTGDLRTLSRQEKERFEFRVKVEDGSSEYEINLSEILEKIGTEAISKMSSTDLAITIIGVALIVGGVVAFRAWLNNRAESRKLDIQDGEGVRRLTEYQSRLEHDTRRYELLATALARQPILQEVEASTEAARVQMVKAISDERGGTVAGVPITPEIGAEIVAQKRQSGQEARLAGVYRVAKVDTTVPDGFRVTLTDVKTNEVVAAAMQDNLLSAEHKQVDTSKNLRISGHF